MQQILVGIILVLGFATYYFYSQNQILQTNNAVLEGAVATQEEAIKSIQADFELQTQQLQ
jgi:Tfp pilus assembly protein PilN